MNWLPEEEFNDSFFDDLINQINFPLEDTTTNGEGEDWESKFQHLEPPPMDLFTTFPSEFTSSHVINKEVAPVPVLVSYINYYLLHFILLGYNICYIISLDTL